MVDYSRLQKDLKDIYGDKTVLLKRSGRFYVLYYYNNIGKAREIAYLLNLMVFRLNMVEPISINNPDICGFPYPSLERYRKTIEKDWKIVIYDNGRIDYPECKTKLN